MTMQQSSKQTPQTNPLAKPMALERLLFSQGFGARRECRALCLNGSVSIQGEVVDDPNALITPHTGFLFCVDGQEWSYHEKAYIALHKPAGYECSHKPSQYASVYTLLPSPLRIRKIQTSGRLDADTTGLLLLSDDGQFIHQTTSGKRNTPKVYHITTKHPVDTKAVDQLLKGVKLLDEEFPIAAAECTILDTHQLELTITTGKYHQVKRMIAAIGNRVEALHRLTVGNYTLPADLKEGQWRWIAADDVL